MIKVFVYGTLKEGGRLDYYESQRESSRDGYIYGELYNINWFPGVLLKGGDKVYGELHTYQSERMLVEFDRVESVGSGLYTRKEVDVFTEDGIEKAWVYEYSGEKEMMGDRIESGTWDLKGDN